jgi:hypothetical protein
MDLCCANSGTRVILTIHGPNGARRVAVRGSLTVKPTTVETEAAANSDGSLYVTTKPVPAEAELKLSDGCGLRLDDLLNCYIDATMEMIDIRRTYLWTKARMVGRPSIETETGEITGLKLVSSNVSMNEVV